MARYTGPKDKISRRFGVAIFGPSKALERRAFGPGQHGARSGRKKQSDYSVALNEKQKLRYQYGLLERQFRRFFEEASRRRGVTGEILLQMLECRLDNVVYRLGLANSRNAARQYVSHGHVTVNGKKVNVPSAQVKPGDVVAMKQNPRAQQMGLRSLDLTQAIVVPDWLTQDRDKLGGKVVRLPSRDEIDPIVNEQLVVELYSR
jgi:small subunit ribosomal protein S4